MPSPTGSNCASLVLPASFDMALGEAPKLSRAALPGASGGLSGDQGDDPDDNVTVAAAPTDAAFTQLLQFLGDRLSPDDVEQAQQLIGQLLGSGNGGSNGNSLAADRRLGTPGYSQRYPNAGRLCGGRRAGRQRFG